MRKAFLRSIVVFSILATGRVWAQAPAPDDPVQTVLAKYRAALPAPEDLTVYSLDWVPTFDVAKQKAVREGRPILLAVVTNSFGDLFSGHC